MMYTSLKAVLPLLAAGAAAKTIRVDVGTNGLTYTPDTVTADPGDVVEFHFSQLQHSVVAADFSNPCTPLGAAGFFSGIIQTTTDSPVFQVTVTSTNPIFFYCTVDQHCQSGMVGVINPGPGQTLDQFRNAAKGAPSGPTPNAPYGGQLISGGERSSTSSSHTSSSTPSSSSTSSSVSTPSSTTSSSTSVSESSVSVSTPVHTTSVQTTSVQTTAVQTTAVQTTAVQSTAVTRATTATTPTVQPTAAAWGLTPPLGAIGGVLAGVAAFVV